MIDAVKVARDLLEYFIPAWVPYPQHLCAYVNCDAARADYRRWCDFHCEVRRACIDVLGGGEVVSL